MRAGVNIWRVGNRLSGPRKLLVALVLSGVLMFPYIFWSVPKAEAAILFVNSTSTTLNGTSITISKPSNTQEGDYMVGIFISNGTPTFSANAGSGTWDSIVRTVNTNDTNTVVQSFRHVVTSSDPTSYTFTASSSQRIVAGILVYRGVDTSGLNGANGIDNSGAGRAETGSSLATQNNAIVANTANTMVISVFGLTLQSGLFGTTSTLTANNTSPNVARFSVNTSCGISCVNTAAAAGEVVGPASGSSITAKTASATNGGFWAAHLVVLKVMAAPTLQQSSYRFLSNMDAANPEYIATNPDNTRDDHLKGIAIDSTNGYLYMGGNNSQNWLTQKRRLDDGSLVTSYGTNGQTSTAITGSGSEAIASLVLDVDDSAFYVAGFTRTGSNNQWRIEKRNANTGNLCTAAECGTAWGTNGVIETNLTSNDDEVLAMAIDTLNNYVYIGGFSWNTTSNTAEWRVGKYNTSNGNLDTGFDTDGYITFDASAEDKVKALAVDPSGGYIYIGGYATTGGDQEWRIEKRKISNGALCTAAACGTQFGTNGVYTSDPDSSGNDQLLAFQVDTPGNAIYAGGYDYLDATNNNQWRIEKLTADTGNLVTGFGTGGAVNYDSGTNGGDDRIIDIDLDDYGGYIFTTGQVLNADDTPDLEWRIEKRQRSDGALVSSFGINGVNRVDPSDNNDSPAWVTVDLPRNLLYTAGGDRTNGTSEQQWRIVKIHMDSGGVWLGNEDAVAVLSTETTFRLRLLIHAGTNTMFANDANYRLKVATKSGTCDTAEVGETYNDVTTSSGEIRYSNNASVNESATVVALTGDPTHETDGSVLQTIEEGNDFTNPTNVIAGKDGLWDFVLKDVGAFGAYCFKVVQSPNTAIGSPVLMPEVTFCRNDPRTANLLRHGTYFCEGVKKGFFWSQDIF